MKPTPHLLQSISSPLSFSMWAEVAAQPFKPAVKPKDSTTVKTVGDRIENLGLSWGTRCWIVVGCGEVHSSVFALAANSRSDGLDAGETAVFKSPSRKSVVLSSAFVHDGRFATLIKPICWRF
jgi:hypothetical protein